jgi:small-conductance mechanosensitive channel
MGDTVRDTLQHALEQFISIGVGLAEAFVVFLGAAIIARKLRRRIGRRLVSTLAPENAKRIVENAVTLVIFGAAATLLLTLWGATWATLLTAIGLSTVFVALGLQGVLQSLVAGMFILFERPYNIGDRVKYSNHDVEGTVEEISLRTTVIRANDGTRVIAPNSFVFTKAVLNYSPDRATLTIITVHGIGKTGRSVEDTRALVENALADVPGFISHPEIAVRSRLRKVRVPGPIARLPRLGRMAGRLAQVTINQGTQVRVTWTGLSDQAVREEVLKRLGALFPDARISLHRW